MQLSCICVNIILLVGETQPSSLASDHGLNAGNALTDLQGQQEKAFSQRFERTFGKLDDPSLPAGDGTKALLYATPYSIPSATADLVSKFDISPRKVFALPFLT